MYKASKRLFDLTLAIIVLIILSPLLIPIIFALRISAEGYIFYFQERVGFQNKKFNIWKFATMLKNSPNMGTGTITLRNDPRVTYVGRFLRITKINELPQAVNVLIGNMSIVGPRPQTENDFKEYSSTIQASIYDVKPGITGIGSIVFRDEEKLLSATDMPPREFYSRHIAPYKGALELWYQQKASFTLDLTIIFLTAWVIFFPKSEMHFRLFKDLPQRPDIFKSEAQIEESIS